MVFINLMSQCNGQIIIHHKHCRKHSFHCKTCTCTIKNEHISLVISGLKIACKWPDTEFLFRKFGSELTRGKFICCSLGGLS